MRYKVDTLFHELLHIFLSRHPIENSALLKEHAAEDERIRDHLHLLADKTVGISSVLADKSRPPVGPLRSARDDWGVATPELPTASHRLCASIQTRVPGAAKFQDACFSVRRLRRSLPQE